jgi:hypothetical protein
VEPAGAQVPRFFCPTRGETISLLPAFLSARLRGTLEQLQAVVEAVEAAPSVAAAAEVLRPAEEARAVTSISAVRWVRRRLRPIRAALLALVTLLPELSGCTPTLGALRAQLGVERVLEALRHLGRAHLGGLSPPLGVRARAGR